MNGWIKFHTWIPRGPRPLHQHLLLGWSSLSWGRSCRSWLHLNWWLPQIDSHPSYLQSVNYNVTYTITQYMTESTAIGIFSPLDFIPSFVRIWISERGKKELCIPLLFPRWHSCGLEYQEAHGGSLWSHPYPWLSVWQWMDGGQTPQRLECHCGKREWDGHISAVERNHNCHFVTFHVISECFPHFPIRLIRKLGVLGSRRRGGTVTWAAA